MGMPERGRLFVAPGAGALEDRLLRHLRDDRDRLRADLSLLARPLRIVVPSGALRAHLAARLTRDGASAVSTRLSSSRSTGLTRW